MIVLSWNVRGLNSIPRQKAIRDLIKSHSPEVVFIQETKLPIDRMHDTAAKIWPRCLCQCIGAQGCSGGLALLWDPRKLVPLWWVSSKSAISLVATCCVTGEILLFTNVYAPIDFIGKNLLWSHIGYVRSLAPLFPWILAGDFNAVLSLEEKRGGNPKLDPSAGLLRSNIESLRVVDITPSNGLYTWNNRRCGAEAIAERLDRFLVSCFWIADSWITSSEILDWRGSDHWPILLTASKFQRTKNPSFRFQLMWLREASLQDYIIAWWREGKPAYGTAMFSFVKQLQYVKFKLKRWNRECFGNLFGEKREAQLRVDYITRQIREQGLSDELYREEAAAVKNLEEWELREEIYWKQKARIDWLQAGDRNTKFFHNTVKDRRKGSVLNSLMTAEGILLSSHREIALEATRFFGSLFSEDSVLARAEEDLILACIPSLVTPEMNEALIKPITLPEIELVVFGMKKGKAPGPDGFPIEFFLHSSQAHFGLWGYLFQALHGPERDHPWWYGVVF